MSPAEKHIVAALITFGMHMPLLLPLLGAALNPGTPVETMDAVTLSLPPVQQPAEKATSPVAKPSPSTPPVEDTSEEPEKKEPEPANSVEPRQPRIESMNSAEIRAAISRYESDLDENASRIRLRLPKRILSFGREFILENRVTRESCYLDEFGELAPARQAGLQAEILPTDLPFGFQAATDRYFRSSNVTDFSTYVVIPANVQLSMFRSLHAYLQHHGHTRPQPGICYTAQIQSGRDFSWSSQAFQRKGN